MMTARTRIKICGITRPEDALAAVEAGVDALGFVFVPASARSIEPEAAADIAALLPAFVARVGLFLDAPAEHVARALDAVPDLVPQFHGTESAAACERHGRPYLKALALGRAADAEDAAHGRGAGEPPAAYAGASAFLLDSHAPGALGGTGVALDWDGLDRAVASLDGRALVLAGGLGPGNVGRAIAALRPFAVDVSSGVESAKGIKDHDAMRAFVRAVRDADIAHDESAPRRGAPTDGGRSA